MKRCRLFFFVAWLAVSYSAGAATIEGATFADTFSSGGKALVANGVGLRTASIFSVNVYAAVLYVEKKSEDAAALLASSGPKVVEMEFLRKVDAEDVRDAWEKSFHENCKPDCQQWEASLAQLKKFAADLKKGDRVRYVLRDDTVEYLRDGSTVGTVSQKGFPRALLATWIGEHPPTIELKRGLLGLAK